MEMLYTRSVHYRDMEGYSGNVYSFCTLPWHGRVQWKCCILVLYTTVTWKGTVEMYTRSVHYRDMEGYSGNVYSFCTLP